MNDVKRVSGVAVVLIVLLRLSIGWQFLYEGLWKYDMIDSATPWSAEGYLKAAQGPFRDHFRAMAGDPDELGWLDFDQMSQRWANWRQRFTTHFKLDEAQQKQLASMIDPPKSATAIALAALPASVDPAKFPVDSATKKPVITYDAEKKQLVVPGQLLPQEVAALKAMVNVLDLGENVFGVRGENDEPKRENNALVPPDAADLAFYKAVAAAEKRANTLSYTQRLTALLKADPDRVGVEWTANPKPELIMGTRKTGDETVDNVRYGEIQVYKDLINEYETALHKAKVDYQLEHVERIGKKLAAKRTEVIGPVKALDAQLQEAARKMLKPEQIALGALPPENTSGYRASQQAMWGLLILGTLLLIGLGTRLAAVGGAVMLMSFYLVVPPWPGVIQPPGPEHSFIVNKNLIEAIALIGIAAMPTGTWFGLDGLIGKVFKRKAAE
ncbi:MAG: DoxX family membrane protein [Planctomycetaceae bacterium]